MPHNNITELFSGDYNEFNAEINKLHGLKPDDQNGNFYFRGIVQLCSDNFPKLSENLSKLEQEEIQSLVVICDKIEDLSKRKTEFYDNSFLGLLKKIYSCFCNIIWLFTAQSSGALAHDLAYNFKNELTKKQNPADPVQPDPVKPDLDKADSNHQNVPKTDILLEDNFDNIIFFDTIPGEFSNNDDLLDSPLSSKSLSLPNLDNIGEEDFANLINSIVFHDAMDGDFEVIETLAIPNDKGKEEIKPAKTVEVSQPTAPKKLSPRAAFFDKIENSWDHIGETEQMWLMAILSAIFGRAPIKDWSQRKDAQGKIIPNEYVLMLDMEIKGTGAPSYGIPGTAILKEEIHVRFSEVQLPNEKYKQEIFITNSSVLQRFSESAFGPPDGDITKLAIRNNPERPKRSILSVGIGIRGIQIREEDFPYPQGIIDFWNDMNWN